MLNVQNIMSSANSLPSELIPQLMDLFQNYYSGKMIKEKLDGKTLAEFRNDIINYINVNYSHKYYLSAKLSLNHLINYFSPDVRISDVTAREIDLFLCELKKSAPRGYTVYYRTLKAAFNKARVWGFISENPFKDIRIGKLQTKRPSVIQDKDLKIILSKIDNREIQLIIQTSYFTGCRITEVINLKVKHINLIERTITIGDDEFITKSKKQRIIPILNKLQSLLKPLIKNRREDDFLFIKTNGFPYTADYISKGFKKAVRKAGLDEGVHFHSLRHSFASNLARQGASPFALKELLGHSSITTSEIYTHVQLEDLKKTVNLLNTRKGK